MKAALAQAIGLVAMAIAILSFQQKTQKRILLMQFCSSTLFTLHYGLIGAAMGSILNGIGIVRAAIFAQRDTKKWAASPVWIPVFIALFAGAYALNFTVLGKEATVRNLLLEILPVIGMTATTISFRMEKAGQVRLFSLISSPLWLIYNACSGSLGGAITEIFSLCSIFIGILRLDRKRKTN